MYLSYILAGYWYNLQEWNFVTLLLVLVGWMSLIYRIRAEDEALSACRSGQPMSSWSATAFSRVFVKAPLRLPAGLTVSGHLSAADRHEDRLGAKLWGARQPFRTSRSRQRNEPPPFLLRQRKRILLISLQRTRTRPLYLLITMIFRFLIPVVKRNHLGFRSVQSPENNCATHDAELIFMTEEPLAAFLKTVPHTRYYPEWRLVTWHPRGLFDDALADKISGVIGTSSLQSSWGAPIRGRRPKLFSIKTSGPLRHPHAGISDRVRRIKMLVLLVRL